MLPKVKLLKRVNHHQPKAAAGQLQTNSPSSRTPEKRALGRIKNRDKSPDPSAARRINSSSFAATSRRLQVRLRPSVLNKSCSIKSDRVQRSSSWRDICSKSGCSLCPRVNDQAIHTTGRSYRSRRGWQCLVRPKEVHQTRHRVARSTPTTAGDRRFLLRTNQVAVGAETGERASE